MGALPARCAGVDRAIEVEAEDRLVCDRIIRRMDDSLDVAAVLSACSKWRRAALTSPHEPQATPPRANRAQAQARGRRKVCAKNMRMGIPVG